MIILAVFLGGLLCAALGAIRTNASNAGDIRATGAVSLAQGLTLGLIGCQVVAEPENLVAAAVAWSVGSMVGCRLKRGA